ncbi:MAG: AzlC family ABC transporter permease [Peptococcaceae bacterium]|nr:AzlC family ABC transporter permease [Peptococcaceae bacterium]
MKSNSECWKEGFKDGIPICLGYIAVSFTFGIMARNAGLTTFQAVLISAVNVTSAGQFAGLGLITAGAAYMEMAVTQFVINLRYCLMSCSLSQKLEPETSVARRLLMSFGITDEIFGVSAAFEGRLNPFYTYGAICVALPGWVLGTFLGVVSGNILPERILSALGVALYGMFIAIIIPPTRKSRVLGGLVLASMAMSFLFAQIPLLSRISSGFKIIILTILIAGVAALRYPVSEEAADER